MLESANPAVNLLCNERADLGISMETTLRLSDSVASEATTYHLTRL